MLVEFSITNFRSIRQKQSLSLVATADREHEASNVVLDIAPGVDRLLKCAVIYGANAAGKSNLLLGLDLLQDMVIGSATEASKGTRAKIKPYRLANSSINEPSTFEVVFVTGGVKYQYGFSANTQRVVEEWLYAFPEKRAQLWFHRVRDSQSLDYVWKFGTSLKGPKQIWSSSTKDGALLLSVAGQLKSEQLQIVYDWFEDYLRVLMTGELTPNFSKRQLITPEYRDQIKQFMRACDIEFDDIAVRDKSPDKEQLELISRMLPVEGRESLMSILIEDESSEVVISRKDDSGEPVWFQYDEESRGTRKLFEYAGPLIDTLRSGYVMVVDELNNSMHPLLAREIIRLVNSRDANKSNAQLIVVTHSTSMLDLGLLRRDQIWFAEKNAGATEFYPLTDFKPRKDVSLAKGYLQGRYGAIPYLAGTVVE